LQLPAAHVVATHWLPFAAPSTQTWFALHAWLLQPPCSPAGSGVQTPGTRSHEKHGSVHVIAQTEPLELDVLEALDVVLEVLELELAPPAPPLDVVVEVVDVVDAVPLDVAEAPDVVVVPEDVPLGDDEPVDVPPEPVELPVGLTLALPEVLVGPACTPPTPVIAVAPPAPSSRPPVCRTHAAPAVTATPTEVRKTKRRDFTPPCSHELTQRSTATCGRYEPRLKGRPTTRNREVSPTWAPGPCVCASMNRW
jgi:hypothetical protein